MFEHLPHMVENFQHFVPQIPEHIHNVVPQPQPQPQLFGSSS